MDKLILFLFHPWGNPFQKNQCQSALVARTPTINICIKHISAHSTHNSIHFTLAFGRLSKKEDNTNEIWAIFPSTSSFSFKESNDRFLLSTIKLRLVIQVHLYNSASTVSNSDKHKNKKGHRSIDKLHHPSPPTYT